MDLLEGMGGLKRTLLLTDGCPTTTGPREVIDEAYRAASHGVVIDTVGVGSPFGFASYDEHLLREIARITGGRFIRVRDVHFLAEEFRRLALEKKYQYFLPPGKEG